MTPRIVWVRSSTGFCRTSALRASPSRDTLRVWVSLRRRSRPKSSPSWCVKCSNSPGCRLSSAVRTPGRLRREARSARLSCSRRKMRSSVSLRVTMTSMVESAICAPSSGGLLASEGVAAAARATLSARPRPAGIVSVGRPGAETPAWVSAVRRVIPPCRSEAPTMTNAPACSQKVIEHTRRSGSGSLSASLKSRGIDNCY